MINREAILHIPLSQYAYAPDEKHITIRLRCAHNNLQECILYYGDRAEAENPNYFKAVQMQIVAFDEIFDYFEVTFNPGLTRVCYYFELKANSERIYYYADLFGEKLPEVSSEVYQYPFIRREEISDVPDWFKSAVVYNIFPDSFASAERYICESSNTIVSSDGKCSKNRHGGTLKGIIANLSYIKNLGFNCIYLNPIFTAGEYHKYDLIDYYHIDPCFGTDDDFGKLVNLAHQMEMRVIIDGVFNHCGWHFFAFEDVKRHGENSKYKDWFYELEFPVKIPENGEMPNYACFAYEPKMPKLNTSNPETREYFLGVCAYWLKKYHIDGWRLDVANEIDREFWRAFRRVAKRENPECVLIGEIWENSENWLRGDMFDSTMNYDFRKNCRDFFAKGSIDAAEFNGRITQMLMRYPAGIVDGQLNLLDSHDVSRFLSECQGDEQKLKLAVLFLMICPGVPCVFYGDELGVMGKSEMEYRQGMPWEKESDLKEFYKQALSLRKQPVLYQGNYKVIYAPKKKKIYVVQRGAENNQIVVLLNAGNHAENTENLKLPNHLPTIQYGWNNKYIDSFGYAVWVIHEEGER